MRSIHVRLWLVVAAVVTVYCTSSTEPNLPAGTQRVIIVRACHFVFGCSSFDIPPITTAAVGDTVWLISGTTDSTASPFPNQIRPACAVHVHILRDGVLVDSFPRFPSCPDSIEDRTTLYAGFGHLWVVPAAGRYRIQDRLFITPPLRQEVVLTVP